MSLWDKFRLTEPPAQPWIKPAISEVFGRTSVAYPEGVCFAQPGKAIGDSRDLHRVLELPRRALLVRTSDGQRIIDPALDAVRLVLERRLSKGEIRCECRERYTRRCAKSLLPIQAWALHEAELCQGLLGPIGVGDGKTLLDLLTPMVLPGCRVAVLLVQPNLRDQLLEVDWHFYGQHWHLPNLAGTGAGRKGFCWPDRPWLHVVAYTELSGARATDLLERIQPDLIIADEAHNIRRRDAARTKRFLRYFSAHPKTRLCAWSGTLTKTSVKDYAHLSNLALRESSPTPLHWPTVEEWAGAIDPSDFPAPIGELRRLCLAGEHVREGWRRRLHESRGVVASPEVGNCDASLVFSERKIALPIKISDHLREINASWRRPDGEELIDALSKARCLREMACGFFYRWRFPRGETEEQIAAWLEARKNWHRELREKLKHSREHMDSPLLCAKAAIRWYEGYVHIEYGDPAEPGGIRYEIPPRTRAGPLPTWESYAWPEWRRLRDTVVPETCAVWVDDFVVRDSADWLAGNAGICWYDHDAFGSRLAELSRAPFYGPGRDANVALLAERGSRSIIASMRAHGTGKNLQMFSRQLVANPPADGAAWEQLIGRTHRQGQLADEVTVEVYRHTPEFVAALDRARDLAGYIQGTMGGSQKLLRATYLFR